MPEQKRLRIHAHGSVEVELIAGCLIDLKYAYDSISVFVSEIDTFGRFEREFPFPQFWSARRAWRYVLEPATPERIGSFVPRAQQLVLRAVELNSPGFLEFIGSAAALEVLRRYLNDRHKRRQDREYREDAEKRRLHFEETALKLDLIERGLKIARDNGATDSDLAPLINELVYKPLSRLDEYQDKNLIEDAEVLDLSDE
jgi:hypothetical protein